MRWNCKIHNETELALDGATGTHVDTLTVKFGICEVRIKVL